ncbi:MAG: hypothetical protein J6386_12755 [Candidatus Synoicihabitans palmerolidicus]|nr:hypothetical protein [Candidatus Synoicihabitans palmerolidicus]
MLTLLGIDAGGREAMSVVPDELASSQRAYATVLDDVVVDRAKMDLRKQCLQVQHELKLEREMVVAAQIAMDERDALAVERKVVAQSAAKVERAREQLAEEQKLWENSLVEIKTREAHLREYETASSVTTPPFPLSMEMLQRSWAELERGRAVLESERAQLREERKVLTNLNRQIRERKMGLRELNERWLEVDRVRRAPPPPSATVLVKREPTGDTNDPVTQRGRLRGFLRRVEKPRVTTGG